MSIRTADQNTLSQRHLNAPRPVVRVPSSSGYQYAGGIWKRNPAWEAMPAVTSSEEKIVILHAVREESEFAAFTITTSAGTYTVDWGDGTSDAGITSGVAAEHLYSYSDIDLAGTDGPVTFTDAGDLVTRNNHGYTDGDRVVFWTVTSTTGISAGESYYVVNATTNTFQVSATQGGSALALTTDGSGTLLPYKQAIITITPDTATIAGANFQTKHSTSGLQAYATGCLDIVLSGPSLTSLAFGGTTVEHRLLERAEFLNIGSVTNMSSMFRGCASLQSVPLFNTASVTTMSSMFFGCSSLQSVPLFNTVSVTTMSDMFRDCFSLQSVPPFNTASVTNMTNMFNGCASLQSVPLFNTASVQFMTNMFVNCYSLQSVPLFDTALVTNMSGMFYGCYPLQFVPLFNTVSVTNMSFMFYDCASLQSVPLFDTALVDNMSSMFSACASLQSVPLFNTASVTNMTSMFQNCYSLQSVPLFDTALVTSMSNMFLNCFSLSKIPAFDASAVNVSFSSFAANARSLAKVEMTGIAEDISFANAKLSAAELDAIYTNLATVVSQTITVSGNYGTAADDPTIATAKNWTVTG